MTELPNEMTLCNLQVLLMPNGEVLCCGKTVGYFRDLAKYLTPITPKASGEVTA